MKETAARNLQGVLDPQPGRLAFALFDDGRAVRRGTLAMHPRDASQVPGFVAAELAAAGVTLNDVPRWSFGSGPGSFTFLRVVAALGAGWAAGNPSIRFRCIPGAVAAAAALKPAEHERVGVIYDGRNREILCFTAVKEKEGIRKEGETTILDRGRAAEFFRENPMRLAAFAADEPVLRAFMEGIADFTVVEPDLSALAASTADFDNDTDKMCYIRPAVAG